jgi:hypothetical protein
VKLSDLQSVGKPSPRKPSRTKKAARKKASKSTRRA